jgi:uncharacterized protein with von Willebrand factor type A (vWA) domain
MRRIRYTKFTGDLASSFGLEDLMQALSDFLLDSGFQDPLSRFQSLDGEQTLENLREAIKQALESGELLDEESQERFDELSAEQVEELVDQIIAKMQEQNFINAEMPNEGQGEQGEGESARFEVTDKAMDFLGYKALRDLLGPLGKASLGRHDTRYEAAGVETNGSSKQYEFGDTLNLDITGTLSNVFAREGLENGIAGIEYSDLQVQQSDYQSSCATVVLLDCSHSMILYGEDRFTPAKRVAMALAHLIRTQYPGDTIDLVLFHDSAEHIPVGQLPRVKVGPHYTNTREGLRVAQRILGRSNKDMKQIVMITDGKPSALTLPDGRIYKNAFGLDPLVIAETLEEVNRCKRSNVMINTFMLASDFQLVQFVQQVSAMCRGKAYFTTPETLGSYLLMDFMSRRMKTVH